MALEVAFDVGGTFTDFVVSVDGTIQRSFLKIPTSVGNPAEAVLQGLRQLVDGGAVAPSDLEAAFHATTVATNAILERKGSRTALVTTAGFRDVLIIGRQKRYETYDLHMAKPVPLVPRNRIFEVEERVGADGTVLRAPDRAALAELVRTLEKEEIESVAVCFLNAYANPANERYAASVIRELAPSLELSISSDISPKIREYERTSTTVANAYVQRLVARYLTDLEGSLAELGVAAKLQVMQSNGGLVPVGMACDYPVRIVESGPAAGVLMCAAVGRAEGLEHLLTFDMGGTTAKLGAVDGGEPAISATFEVDAVQYKKGSGLPLNIPSVELIEIGAGGGSIAEAEMGIIKVGPRSAASVPGPVCYRRGGTEPTVTDANLVLGYIDPERFNGGAMRLDREAATRAISERIAEPLDLSVEKAAWGIHALATNNMERALRIVSIERGRDPRAYALVAFGGAGPLHAARLARQAAIPRVVIPVGAGVGSAVGLLNATPKLDASLTRVVVLRPDAVPTISEIYAELDRQLKLDCEKLDSEERWGFRRFAYMRYRGQGFEIRVDLDGGDIDAGFVEAAERAFAASYRRIYGAVHAHGAIEVTDWYLVGIGAQSRRRMASPEGAGGNGAANKAERRRSVYFPELDGYVSCPVYDRYRLTPADRVIGPAIIEENETSTVLLPGDTAAVSEHGNLVIAIGGDAP